MVGIDHTLLAIGSLRTLALDGMAMVKAGGGLSLATVPKALAVVGDLHKVAVELGGALSELKDIDLEESGRLVAALGSVLRDILVAAAGK